MSFAGKLMELEINMLSQISQTQKVKYRILSLIGGIQEVGEESRKESHKKIDQRLLEKRKEMEKTLLCITNMHQKYC